MTGRGVAVQGGLAALGLVIAYTTWQREPEGAVGDVVVVDSTKGNLTNVHFEDDTTSVDIQRGDGSGGPGVWLRIQDKVPVPPPPAPPPAKPAGAGGAAGTAGTGGAAGSTTAAAKPPVPTPPTAKPRPARLLRGEEPAEKFLAQFAPFRSPRAFGVLDAKKQKELGLDTAKKKLVITARGETRSFVIGQPAQGSGENYLRDANDGRTYLMPRQVLTDLQSAAHRLVDRRLHTFKVAEINRLAVSSSGKKREFVVKNQQDQNAYKLAPANAPDKPEEMARNWHDKIWRLFPSEVLGKGENPAEGQPKIALRVDYFDGSKNVGWLEIGKLDVAPGTEPAMSPHAMPTNNNGTALYGRTEHTSGWVRLPNDPSTLADADKVASGL